MEVKAEDGTRYYLVREVLRRARSPDPATGDEQATEMTLKILQAEARRCSRPCRPGRHRPRRHRPTCVNKSSVAGGRLEKAMEEIAEDPVRTYRAGSPPHPSPNLKSLHVRHS